MRGEELGRQGTGPAPPITGRGCQSSGREEQRERRPASRIRKGERMMRETHVAVCVRRRRVEGVAGIWKVGIESLLE